MATKRKPAARPVAKRTAPAPRPARPAAGHKLAPVVEPDGTPIPSPAVVELAPVVDPS